MRRHLLANFSLAWGKAPGFLKSQLRSSFFGSQIHVRNSFTEHLAWRLEGDVGGLVGFQPLLTVNVLVNGTVATSLAFQSSQERRKRVRWSRKEPHELQRGDLGWQRTDRQCQRSWPGSANRNTELLRGHKLFTKGPILNSLQRYQSRWEFSVSRKQRNELQTFRSSSTWVVYYAWTDSHWLQQHWGSEKALTKRTLLQNLGLSTFSECLWGASVERWIFRLTAAFSPICWY